MSRAFVKESDDAGEPLPERPISAHPNFVTPQGQAAIEARVHELEAARQSARASEDRVALATIERDLRYWTARRASARLVAPATSHERVRFGMAVTLQAAGASVRFRLVGEDEADAARGLLSWVAPLGQALLGRELGEAVLFQGVEAEIVSIEP
jgi:transcription elongation GreA/GreB family factor